MKIAYVITELNEGGAEHALEKIAVALSAQGHEIGVSCLFGGTGEAGKRLAERGIRVNDLQLERPRQAMRVLKMRRWLRQFAPDVVHSWLFHGGMAARLTIPSGIPLIHGLRVVQHRRWMTVAERWLRPGRVNAFACVSSDVREFAGHELRIPTEICRVIENGIDLAEYAAARAAIRDYDQLRGLTVARLAYQKGLDIFIEALARLPADLPWTWTFVGRDEEPDYARFLKDRARSLRIDHRLQWAGFVPRSEMAAVYAQANLLALPSRWEGQANAVLEAMASKVPVMAADCSGIKDIRTHSPDCLRTVEPNQPGSWSEALRKAWQERARLPRQAAVAAAVMKNYDWLQVAAEYLNFYRQVTAAKRGNAPR